MFWPTNASKIYQKISDCAKFYKNLSTIYCDLKKVWWQIKFWKNTLNVFWESGSVIISWFRVLDIAVMIIWIAAPFPSLANRLIIYLLKLILFATVSHTPELSLSEGTSVPNFMMFLWSLRTSLSVDKIQIAYKKTKRLTSLLDCVFLHNSLFFTFIFVIVVVGFNCCMLKLSLLYYTICYFHKYYWLLYCFLVHELYFII